MNWLTKKNNKSNEIKKKFNHDTKKNYQSFFKKLTNFFKKKIKIDDQILDELEEVLISSDVGISTTIKIIENIEKRIEKDKYNNKELNLILKEEIENLLIQNQNSDFKNIKNKPYIIMVVGVNGVGKTTTIAKLANQFKNFGLKVVLGAGDTFRAGAIDQLSIWSKLIKVPIIKKNIGTDPGSVAFETVQYAIKNKIDIVLLDTAGRLHNKINLMKELEKIKRVIQKIIIDAPHETLLILDGSTGQNAFEQTKNFKKIINISSIGITKLDGTAKGGVIIGISDQFKIPIKYIGTGEKLQDLKNFDKSIFINELFYQTKFNLE